MSERETFTTSPDCLCGCGSQTRGGNYRPGHDAKHVAWLMAMVRCGYDCNFAIEKLPTPALHNKTAAQLRRAGYTYSTTWGRWFAPGVGANG